MPEPSLSPTVMDPVAWTPTADRADLDAARKRAESAWLEVAARARALPKPVGQVRAGRSAYIDLVDAIRAYEQATDRAYAAQQRLRHLRAAERASRARSLPGWRKEQTASPTWPRTVRLDAGNEPPMDAHRT
jgi:hypothetical protein